LETTVGKIGLIGKQKLFNDSSILFTSAKRFAARQKKSRGVKARVDQLGAPQA
jgi:hypothetical protein